MSAAPFTTADLVACVTREVRMRERVYGRRVAEQKMNPLAARREIELMRAVLARLQADRDKERLL